MTPDRDALADLIEWLAEAAAEELLASAEPAKETAPGAGTPEAEKENINVKQAKSYPIHRHERT